MVHENTIDIPSRVALVHEWFTPHSTGGAEQVVKAIDELLLGHGCIADLAALVDGESSRPASWLFSRPVKTSFIQKLPLGVSRVQNFLPLLPFAIEQLDLSDYPLIISSSHLVAKGVLTNPEQVHISYVHTPVRYAWDQMHIYLKRSALSRVGLGPLIRWQLHCLRQWDQLSAIRVNYILANSRFTARRISSFWGRKAEVLHPPVNVERFRWNLPREDFYLCLSRLVPNKRVDLVVEAFNNIGLPLYVVGEGPEKNFLRGIAGPTIKILGYQSKTKVEELMGRCRAFVYAGMEDFGIAPVEAMAAGAPVIGLGKGGLLDTVRCISKGISHPTGILFSEQTASSLIDVVSWFEESKLWREFSPESNRLWAENFRPELFSLRFERVLKKVLEGHRRACAVASSDPAGLLDF